ncbi:MAG: rhomboid family intramembrane serine protease [Verrucomicrobiota bacterium]
MTSWAERVSLFFEWVEEKAGTHAGFLIGWLVLLWGLEGIDFLLGGRLDGFGIRPRQGSGLGGILAAPLLHGGFSHLMANTPSLFALAWLVILTGWKRFWQVTGWVVLVGGFGVWLFGKADSVHLGASGLIFGYFGYLLALGWAWKSLWWALASLITAVVFGSLFFGILPLREASTISWEGHLLGLVAGVGSAFLIAPPQVSLGKTR